TSFNEYRQTNQVAGAVSAISGIVHQCMDQQMKEATKGTGGSTKGTQSRQQSASESALAEEPVQTTCQMEETLLPVYETGADEQP
nr:hypothetical protein [Tanacetum cinerariifolium]